MKMQEILKLFFSSIMIFSLVLYVSFFGIQGNAAEKKKSFSNKDFLVKLKTSENLQKLERRHRKSEKINANSQDMLKRNKLVSLKLSSSELEYLEKSGDIAYAEEDVTVKGSGNVQDNVIAMSKSVHDKKERVIDKNAKRDEWNIQMIHAEKSSLYEKRDRVKIAVLDSGVDYGNDIDLAGTVSLIPGEEEISPLFIDGSGHGSSVAGLISAKDDGKGITGINPDAEIYSIRVLDDENKAPLSRVIEGIYMAIDKDVNIINMSFGVSTYSRALEEAVKAATDAGILVVAAAGNTGNKGVQFPAAYDNVIAVGSVDKKGEVVKSSARGKELDLVAPGELVRSTGFLGDELVASGTSLATPQVTAVASLIWQKDINVSSDFVSALLIQSANLYGDRMEYGYGMLDADYAMKQYKQFKKKYKKGKKRIQYIDENSKEILCFNDTGCVSGSWSVTDHEGMVPSTKTNVRKGARFPDLSSKFKGLSSNPWWHGSFRLSNNYIKSYICATKIADNIGKGKGADISYSYDNKQKMVNLVKEIDWKTDLTFKNEEATKGRKRAFIWGMAIHTLSDTFAHSVYVYDTQRKCYRHLDHPYPITENPDNGWADDTTQISKRWADAKRAVDKAIDIYNSEQNGTYHEYDVIISQHIEYYLRNLANNVKEIDSSEYARFLSFTYTSSMK